MPDGTQPRDTWWWKLVHLEPVVWKTLILTVVAVLGSVGILVSDDLANNLVLLLTTLLGIVQIVWTRPSVTANAKVVVEAPDPAGDPYTVAPGEAVTKAPSDEIVRAAYTLAR